MRKVQLVALVGALFASACGGPSFPPNDATCGDAAEPNNLPGEAAAGGVLTGLRACAGDHDRYLVTLGKPDDDLQVRITATQGSVAALLVSVRKDGAVVANLVASGDKIDETLHPGAGEYEVLIENPGPDTVTYDLIARALTCPEGLRRENGACIAGGCGAGVLEPNEDVPGAIGILPGTYRGLGICQAGDRDFFALSPPPGGAAVTVSLRLTGAGGDLDMYLTDGTMNGSRYRTLGVAQGDGSEDYMVNVPVPDGAPVYLVVVGVQDATNDYDLEVVVDPINPKRDCLNDCATLVPMWGATDPDDPMALIDGYFVGTDAEYAFARRDMAMLLHSAFAEVAKKFPGTNPVYLSDLSQADGKTPGVDVNQPRHPTTTHVKGRDVDVAYFQTGPDNDYRIICGDGTDRNGNGRKGKFNDGYFCTTDQNVVDVPRQTYFMAMLMGSPLFRVLGIDQTLPDLFFGEVDRMVSAGELPAWASARMHDGLAWGDAGGWAFHHHHIHLSLFDR
jgi:hypothetical protein